MKTLCALLKMSFANRTSLVFVGSLLTANDCHQSTAKGNFALSMRVSSNIEAYPRFSIDEVNFFAAC